MRLPAPPTLLALAALLLVLGLAAARLGGGPAPLRLSGGATGGHRHALAEALGALADPDALAVEVLPTDGSRESLSAVAAGSLDAALVQGGLGPVDGVCQLAPVLIEPLHVLVRGGLPLDQGLEVLRGRRVNLSTAGSGTRLAAERLLSVAGVSAGAIQPLDLPYEQLERLRGDDLPDVLFTVSPLPSPLADRLVRAEGYRLLPLPWGEAVHLRAPDLRPALIPGGAYGLGPAPEPPSDLPTVGARLLLVARCDLDPGAARALLGALTDDRFAQRAGLPLVPEAEWRLLAERPQHAAVGPFLRRHDPAWTGGDLEWIESLRSLLGSVGLAAFFGWRWLKRRRLARSERFIGAVASLEDQVGTVERTAGHLDLDALLALRQQLGALKAEALRLHAEGQLEGAETLATFLAQVTDARHHLNALILHERERREEEELALRTAHASSAAPTGR